MSRSIWLSWSSGKDSAWTLHRLQQSPGWAMTGLFTTVNEAFDRVAMHAVRRQLLEAQAAAAGVPLHVIPLPWPCNNATYEQRMAAFLETARAHDVHHMAFGDLFLEDVRAYREANLADQGIEAVFPLWGEPTGDLAREMICGGLEGFLTCIDPRQMPRALAGARFDDGLLDALPAGVDPCGERGEFHTVVTGGPMFKHSLDVNRGETVERDGFVFTDFELSLSTVKE
ncbi:hypothetical protein QQM79_14640 [Marinobacteraceae bacterium S3BR75-40.1]